MDMKWNPIIDGDLSGIPEDEEFLFTIIDKEDNEHYVITAYIKDYDGELELREVTASGLRIHEAEDVMAWMELPEPYKPIPDKCFKCNHGKVQHGESSDNWFECELLKRDVPPNGKPNDCPLNR